MKHVEDYASSAIVQSGQSPNELSDGLSCRHQEAETQYRIKYVSAEPTSRNDRYVMI